MSSLMRINSVQKSAIYSECSGLSSLLCYESTLSRDKRRLTSAETMNLQRFIEKFVFKS